jgi:hypothetical protein
MCTVTVVPDGRGVRLVCNRDQQRTRPAASPPQIHALGAHRAVFPLDPQGGGTWIGVNDAGLVVALLNRQPTALEPEPAKRSRGLIVRELLQFGSLPDVATAIGTIDPRGFAPFEIVAWHDGHVAIAASNGAQEIRTSQRQLDAPLLLTSSSLGDAFVAGPRRRLFERMVDRSRDGWLKGQARFHDHQWPRRPEISVRMERPDAMTVSRTTVDVANGVRHLLYEAPLRGGATGVSAILPS